MQLRGLVAVFTILLIIYSVWLLSFTFFVNKHENKIAKRAQAYMHTAYPESKKYSDPENYSDTLKAIYKERLTALLDSSKEDKITWFGNTYAYAREKELNLGLDVNVTAEFVGFNVREKQNRKPRANGEAKVEGEDFEDEPIDEDDEN